MVVVCEYVFYPERSSIHNNDVSDFYSVRGILFKKILGKSADNTLVNFVLRIVYKSICNRQMGFLRSW